MINRNIFKSSEDVAFHTKENLHDILDELHSWRENMMPPNPSNKDSLNPSNKETLNPLNDAKSNVPSNQNHPSNGDELSNHNIHSNKGNLNSKNEYVRADSLRNHGHILSSDEVFQIKSSMPDWLQDMLVNSLSFWRTGFWVADGRWRQWETFDCNDIDSIHNDFQRELPYVLFFPGKTPTYVIVSDKR